MEQATPADVAIGCRAFDKGPGTNRPTVIRPRNTCADAGDARPAERRIVFGPSRHMRRLPVRRLAIAALPAGA